MDAVLVVSGSKVVCMCAEPGKTGGYRVIGEATAEHEGIKKNTPPTATGITQAIHQALDSVQFMTGKRVKALTVGVPGLYSMVKLGQGETPAEKDLLENEYEFLYSTPILRNKEYKSSAIMSFREYSSLINSTLGGMGISVQSFVSQPQSEGLYIIPPGDRVEVAIMVDVGYYITDVCVFSGDALVSINSLYVGGSHMSADLAQVLEIGHEQAEQLRRQYTFGIDSRGDTVDYVRMPDGKLQPFVHTLVGQIIQARMEETCSLIGSTIRASGFEIKDETKVYLTGEGFAPMNGSREYLSAQIGLPVHGLPIDLTDGTIKRNITALSMVDRLYNKVERPKGAGLKGLFQKNRTRHKRVRAPERWG